MLGTGHLSHGVWHGNLYLHGGGDPTFGDSGFNHVWNDGYGPTPNELIAQLRRRGIRRVTGRVFGDESLFDHRRGALITDYKPDTPDLGGQLSALTYDHGTVMPHYDPATFAAHQFVSTMRALGIQAVAGRHDGTAPLDAQILATVASPPMSVMLRLMNVPSDDLFAELFAKQLGVRFGDGGTITSGAHVIAQTIASRYGLDPTILDGSGLGRQDRTSPEQIVQLLTALWHTRLGDQLAATLPTVGVNGTVQVDRAQDRRRPPLHRQDRLAGRRHESRRLLLGARRPAARVRVLHRRTRELDRLLAGEQDDRGDRSVLTPKCPKTRRICETGRRGRQSHRAAGTRSEPA